MRSNLPSRPELPARHQATAITLYIAMLCWSLDPHQQTLQAAYVPDENGNPTWTPAAGESATAPAQPNTADSNENGTQDWLDEFNDMAANGLFTYWSGGSAFIDGVQKSYGGQWHAPSGDTDGDLLPDDLDPYPSDATNNSFFWNGGTFTVNNLQHTFRSGWYAGSENDGNSNSIPDSLDDWFTNPSAHGTLQHWAGGTVFINGESNTYGAVDYYADSFTDTDADGIPNELDAFPSDPWNNTSYQWNGGDYYIDGTLTHFPPATYSGTSSDTDGDGIPDVADPLSSDSNNNSTWWSGGGFTINNSYQTLPGQYHRADAADADSDNIPDDIDPYPGNSSNADSYTWNGGYFYINNQNQYFDANTYSGLWEDSDGDGIPNPADPYPSDANNANVTNSFYWAGGYYTVSNNSQFLGGTTYSGSWSDQDNDGIPDPADAYPNDSNNGNSAVEQFYWNGGSYTINHQETYFSASTYPGTWADTDSDGIPDSLDPYPSESNNGNETFYWPGGSYRINNNDVYFASNTYNGTWSDQDSDGIPDVEDTAYPNDANNGNSQTTPTFYWGGGTFRISNADTTFPANTYNGTWTDDDNDGIPNVEDTFPNDSNNGNSTFTWTGGTYRIDNGDHYFANNTYPGTWTDSDGDGIPDSLDPYPSDSGNGNSQFYWGGGTFRISNAEQTFPSNYYPGNWGDEDGDGIPDAADPYVYDSLNNCNEFWWQGGYFTINNSNTYFAPGYYAGEWSDQDYDSIPDSIDPYPSDSNNGNSTEPPSTYYWAGGNFHIDGVETTWPAADYAGTWSDSDNDNLPDNLDFWANDSANNSIEWAGGTFDIDGSSQYFAARWHRANASDSDNDTIPDDIDPYPQDQYNNTGFTWPEQTLTLSIADTAQVFTPTHYGAEWSDFDEDGIPDLADPLPNDFFNNNDTDGDGIPDDVEALYPEALSLSDGSDAVHLRGDGLSFLQAYNYDHTRPLDQLLTTDTDTDADGLPDVIEIIYGLDWNNSTDAVNSLTNDFVANLTKYQLGLDLATPVSSADFQAVTGLPWSELQLHVVPGLSYAESDWDADGISNLDELLVFHTDPYSNPSQPVSGYVPTQPTPTPEVDYWPGGLFTINGTPQPFEGREIERPVLDSDGDSIPDIVDPYINDSSNNSPPPAPDVVTYSDALASSQVLTTQTLVSSIWVGKRPVKYNKGGTSTGGTTQNLVPATATSTSPPAPTSTPYMSGLISSLGLSGKDKLTPPLNVSNDVVAGVGGALQVGPDGTANYSIPLVLPKGTAGLEPQLALAYSSASGDGYLGLGWNLSGLGSITRGGSNYYKDGVTTGVAYNGDDRFYFNGERLVYTGTRSDFKNTGPIDGEEFRTEMNQFSRIIYHGTALNDYWTVETKGGLKLYLGGDQTPGANDGGLHNSRICPEPDLHAMTWAVCRAEDLTGNYFTVSYKRDNLPNGSGARCMDFAPDKICYTGNERIGLKPYIQVSFSYLAKPNKTFGFIKGGMICSNYLMDRVNVTTSVGNDTNGSPSFTSAQRYYKLTYDTSPTSGRARVTKVQEFFVTANGDKGTLPTVFSWQTSSPGWTRGENIQGYSDPEMGDQGRRLLDMDGDGLDDLVWSHYLGRNFTQLSKPSGTSGFAAIDVPEQTSNFNSVATQPQKGLMFGVSSSAVSSFGGPEPSTSAWLPPVTMSANGSSSAAAEWLDFDGDGRPDIVANGRYLARQQSDQLPIYMWDSYNSKPTGSNWQFVKLVKSMVFPTWTFNSKGSYTSDFTNANMPVSIRFFPDSGALTTVAFSWDVTLGGPLQVSSAYRNTGSGWTSADRFRLPTNLSMALPGTTPIIYPDNGRRFVDLNGDGLVDMINGMEGQKEVWLNRGPDSSDQTPSSAWDNSSATAYQYKLLFESSELKLGNTTVGYNRNAGDELITTSSGSTPEAKIKASNARLLSDINGDGLVDFMETSYTDALPDSSTGAKRVDRTFLNTGSGWKKVYDSAWSMATATYVMNSGYPSFYSPAQPEKEGSNWVLPRAMSWENGRVYGGSLQDVNGDGLPDYILSREHYKANFNSNGAIVSYSLDPINCLNFVYLNTGSGWEKTPNVDWVLPGYLFATKNTGFPLPKSFLLDVNSDGLPDFVSAYPGREGVWLNTGNGWASSSSGAFLPPLALAARKIGDPLFGPPPGYMPPPVPNASKLDSFKQAAGAWALPAEAIASNSIAGFSLTAADVNSDGFIDLISTNSSNTATTWINNAKPELIVAVTQGQDTPHGLGLTTNISYNAMNRVFTDPFTGEKVYSKGAGDQIDSKGRSLAVERISADPLVWMVSSENGKGGTVETHYRYGGRLVSTKADGDLGFAWTETWSQTREKDTNNWVKMRSLTQHRQDWPFEGQVARTRSFIERKRAGFTPSPITDAPINDNFGPTVGGGRWQLLTESTASYADLPVQNNFTAPGGWHFIIGTGGSEQAYDLETGTLLETSVSTSIFAGGTGQLDNVTKMEVKTYAGTPVDNNLTSTKTTTTEFSQLAEPASGEKWMLGRLKLATTNHLVPGSNTTVTNVTKRVGFNYYGNDTNWPGMIKDEIIEPDSNGSATADSITKTTTYDIVGNAIGVTTKSEARNTTPGATAYPGATRSASESFDPDRYRFSLSTKNALNHEATKSFDQVKSIVNYTTDANGFKTRFVYDDFGTVTEEQHFKPDGTTVFTRAVKFTKFCAIPGLPEVKYATIAQASGGLPSASYHDKYGRVLLSESFGFEGKSVIAQVFYNDQGKAVSQCRPYFKADRSVIPSLEAALTEESCSYSQFDELGRSVRSVGTGSTITRATDGQMNSTADLATTVTSYQGYVTTVSVTTSGKTETATTRTNCLIGGYRVNCAEDTRNNKATTFYFTADGLEWKTTTPSGKEIVKTYSTGRRELLTLTDPDAGTSTTEYDGLGQVRKVVNASNQSTEFLYDILGRQTDKITPEGTYHTDYEATNFTGSPKGPWVGMASRSTGPIVNGTSGSYEVTSLLDSFGRAVSSSQKIRATPGGAWTTHTSYTTFDDDYWGRVTDSTDVGGFKTTPVYHPDLGYSTSVTAAIKDPTTGNPVTKTLWTLGEVDALGRTLSQTFGDGAQVAAEYDTRTGRLIQSQTSKDNDIIEWSTYTSDNRGNINTRTREALEARGLRTAIAAKTEVFHYDALDRLIDSTVEGQTQEAFTFDDLGNLTTKSKVGTYHYTDSARPSRLNTIDRIAPGGAGVVQHFDYDDEGRVEHDWFTGTSGARERQFEYTSWGQIRHIEANNMPATVRPGTSASSTAKWGRTTIDFQFGPGGGRYQQIKEQAQFQAQGNADKGDLRKTITTYLSGMDIEQSEKYFANYGYAVTSIERKHYFGGGVYIERQKAAQEDTPVSLGQMASTTALDFYHGDNIGSPSLVTNEQGGEEERQSYDPWGARRDASTWATAPSSAGLDPTAPKPISSQHKPGFTGHEMLDDVGIIHMNGRIYDPEIGRFLMPDPVIQAPGDSQSFGAYTYVMNNPLKLTDPSGYTWAGLGEAMAGVSGGPVPWGSAGGAFGAAMRWAYMLGGAKRPWTYAGAVYAIGQIGGAAAWHQFNALSKKVGWKNARNHFFKMWGVPIPTKPKRNWLQIIVTIVVAVALVFLAPGTSGLWSSIQSGAMIGFGTSAAMTALAGGSWSDILVAGLKGAVTGAITGAAGHYIHGFFAAPKGAGTLIGQAAKAHHWATAALLSAERASLHGAVGGLISLGMGGNFRDGFIGAATGSLLSPVGDRYLGTPGVDTSPALIAGRTAFAALIGGTASSLTGGKFANGAISAAFLHLFNHEVKGAIAEQRMNSLRSMINKGMASRRGPITVEISDQVIFDTLETAYLKYVANGVSAAMPLSQVAALAQFGFADTYLGKINRVWESQLVIPIGGTTITTGTGPFNYLGVGALWGAADQPYIYAAESVTAWKMWMYGEMPHDFTLSQAWAEIGWSYSTMRNQGLMPDSKWLQGYRTRLFTAQSGY